MMFAKQARFFLAGLCFVLMASATAVAQDLSGLFEERGLEGTVVIERWSDRLQWVANPERADQRFLPASTFKIPNSLIILEAGIVSDAVAQEIEWDGVERGGSWDQNQTLRSAFHRSAVWAYQHWARRVGHERMASLVAALEYGNGDIGDAGSIDTFWLSGPLQISALEQIEFLQRLYQRDLPFRPDVMQTVIDIMEADAGENWTLRAKTGWAIRDEPNLGWYVGWLETSDNVYFFALNMDLDWQTGDGAQRMALARAALSEISGIDLDP